ncbi:MAG: hypothetical protein A2857_05775 [Candidatus Levybacteria bacterium RIFCSPHIGHO2_01_FULL_36_15]|nr:MAG: hypothetical protein A2857_05775 [Candidatus Levybacteria bacterium RIFCSPHIGHO2_01_FULL_36_15]OGH38405.1 MAG: hypothetical protein A2905_00575 [Candidatus Levybacteria bacterium RIFCSPLOWO2_01_FULL_36_10]
MSKKRRTKREKLATQLRKQSMKKTNYSKNSMEMPYAQTEKTSAFNTYSIAFPALSQESKQYKKTASLSSPIQDEKYSYVLKDIKKTIIVISTILIFNLGIFVLLKNNIVNFKFLGL